MESGAPNKSSGFSTVYSGAATFGRVYATLGAIIGIIIMLLMVYFGVKKLRDPHTGTVDGVITKILDHDINTYSKNTTTYNYILNATYVIGGHTYQAIGLAVRGVTPYAKGGPIVLRYNPAKPQSVIHEMSPRKLGWGLIGAGILIGSISTGIAVLTFKSKGFAAGFGAVEGIGMIGQAL